MKKESKEDMLIRLLKVLEKADIITFDPKEIAKKIKRIYDIRNKGHRLLLQADSELDLLVKFLSGYDKK